MKIKYLGTAATEGIPAPFCDCRICKDARKLGGREIRSRSQALINDKLLIDFNADSFYHAWRFGLDYVRIRHCIITHVHTDHFYPPELRNLRPGYTEWDEGTPPFTIYGSEDLLPILESGIFDTTEDHLVYKHFEPYVTYEIEDLKVTPMKAAHGTPHPYIYIIGHECKTMLYGNDTGYFLPETWDYLIEHKPRFDLVSLDCTEGGYEEIGYNEHMCFGVNKRVKRDMLALGLVDEKTVFVLHHFSHSGKNVLYRDMVPLAATENMLVSYDGMEIEF